MVKTRWFSSGDKFGSAVGYWPLFTELLDDPPNPDVDSIFLKCQFFMVFVGLFIAIQWFMFHEFHVKVLKSLHFPRFLMANSPGPARDYSRVTGAFDRLVKAEDVQMKPGIQSCSMGNPLKLGKREWECFKAKYSLWNGELRVECLKHMIGYVVCNFDEIREAQIG